MNDGDKGGTNQAKGSIKEAIGMLIGDPVVQAQGAAEKAGRDRKKGGSRSTRK